MNYPLSNNFKKSSFLLVETSAITPFSISTLLSAFKNFFTKKVIVTLDNGAKHVFNYGMLNVDPVADAIMG